MKLSLFIIILFPLFIWGQDYSKFSYHLAKEVSNEKFLSKNYGKQVPIIVKGDSKKLTAFVLENGGIIKYHVEDLMAVTLPSSKLSSLAELPFLTKAEGYTGPLFFHDEVALSQTLVDTVHAGGGNLQQPYTGNGVIFGMIDSGIDPTHPDFQNDDGTTRILAFWDQKDTSSSLNPYGYGKGYTQESINNGAMANYLDSVYDGHGTAVAGVAVGGGKAHPDIIGMAPDAHIIAVGIDPSVLDYLDRTPSMLQIVDGIDYIFRYADSLNMPAVINISLGGIEGSHDGKDLPTQMIEAMLEEKNGRALITSAGNSAQTKHHVQFNVDGDTLFTWFKGMYSDSEVCKRDSGAYMSFYGDSIDVAGLKISIAVENRIPCCNIIDQTDFQDFLHPLGTIRVDTLWDNNEPLGIVSTFVEKIDDVYAWFMEIKSTNMGVLWRCSVTGNGKIDGWAGPTYARSCNSEYINHPGTVGSSSQIENYNNYVRPDNNQTIGTAYASSRNVITVGAHTVRTSMMDVDSIQRTYGGTALYRASFSSIGPSRDNRIKPDIMGPGRRIVTTQASQILADKAINARSSLYLGGQHAVTDGTSFASPAVAGIVALYFEKYPDASYADVIHAVVSTADQDIFMDSIPNNSYGYGRINAYQMLLTQPTYVENNFAAPSVLLFPNPTKGLFNIVLPYEKNERNQFEIYNLLGKQIHNSTFDSNQTTFQLEERGTYIIKIKDKEGNVYISKLIVN